ncbi:restriction endonuclease [Escherichia albertii]|uniref:restriction endonuclease n=1 Tax=Escherichia albertii TaxID=208962 RepID=UPI001D7C20BB|nr:restriction endonuclease [Escherichia albertii]EHX2144242.1 restriction endonuclease [Escherichia albertii]MCE7721099.1 restriction endonuclease [Escherichia albertii]MCE7724922.1 restriction endonuclease [Escherichia albertii]MCZ8864572.1 restriction endonuclease [Escherichia albertii]
MRGIGKILKSGKLFVNWDDNTFQILKESSPTHIQSLDTLDAHGWGSLYEKHVGQFYQEKGYEVIFQGITMGLRDGGIDLIMRKGEDVIYAQCKYKAHSKMSRNAIEKILYSAGNFIHRTHKVGNAFLWLIVPDEEKCFAINAKSKLSSRAYFEHHNKTQNKVRLAIIEVKM